MCDFWPPFLSLAALTVVGRCDAPTATAPPNAAVPRNVRRLSPRLSGVCFDMLCSLLTMWVGCPEFRARGASVVGKESGLLAWHSGGGSGCHASRALTVGRAGAAASLPESDDGPLRRSLALFWSRCGHFFSWWYSIWQFRHWMHSFGLMSPSGAMACTGHSTAQRWQGSPHMR